ncbi:ATP-binding protein [Desulfonatronum thiodismutans]
MITANLSFDEWTRVFGDVDMRGGLLDRVKRHFEIMAIGNASWGLG